MKIILARHGETVGNINRVIQGHADTALSEEGVKQAQKLAKRLENERIDAVFSSDLTRAVRTAGEILKFHPEIDLTQDERLRERCFGEFEGKPLSQDWDWSDLPDSIETNEAMCERVETFLKELNRQYCDKTVLIVSHFGTKLAFLNIVHKNPISEFDKFNNIKNTAISVFEFKEDKNHIVHLVNCAKHLEGEND